MPTRIRTLEDSIADLRRLSKNSAENADSLPDITAEKGELDKSLELFDEAQQRQKMHEAGKQKATQDMALALGRGKEAARQIRLGAKLKLGARSEMLVLFNVAPLRTRAGRRAAVLNLPEEPKDAPAGTQTPPAPKPTNP